MADPQADGKSPQAPLAKALAEADAKSMDELFSRDPYELTVGSKSLDALVLELRRYSAIWAKEEAEGKTRSSTKGPKIQKPNVSLKDLGL